MNTPELVKFLRFATKEIIQQEDLINPIGFVITEEGVGVVPFNFAEIMSSQEVLKNFGTIIKQSNSKEAVLVLDVITKKYEVDSSYIVKSNASVSERGDSVILMLHIEIENKDLNFNIYMQPYVKAMEGYAFADDLVVTNQIDEAMTRPVKEGFL